MEGEQLRFILALDTGEIHHGVALVRYDGDKVKPLYLGTLRLEPKPLNDLVEPRAASRRIRRTSTERKRRLKRLRDLLTGKDGPLHGDRGTAAAVLAYCKRRGHFHEDGEAGEEEIPAGSISNNQFQEELRTFLSGLIPEKAEEIHKRCVSVLGRKSRRPMRTDARGVGVCAWEGCKNRVTRAGLGSLVMGVSGKMKPLIERGAVSREKIEEVCRKALEGDSGKELLLRGFDQAVLGAYGLPPRLGKRGREIKPHDSIKEWIGLLPGPENGYGLPIARKRADEIRRGLLLWVGKRKKESIREAVGRDLESARKRATARGKGENLAGRSRFCPEHQEKYIDFFLKAETYPVKETSADVSRKASVLADKIHSYLLRRVLPLLNGELLDGLVIESSGFDALRMLTKKNPDGTIKKEKEEKAYELYWRGPRAEFGSVEEMLRVEFKNLCAYCGEEIKVGLEQDHVLPRARFPMDGYLVRVPCHSACNREKGKDSLFRRRLAIHPAALKAFEEYVEAKKRKDLAIHPIIEVKKGLLQNMTAERLREKLDRCGGDTERAEQSLQEMAGGWMIRTTATSRYSRHLRRELATRLGVYRGRGEQAKAVSGRHTAILRAALTDGWNYDKTAEKEACDRVENHALDAYVLALGTATGLFARLAMAERFDREITDALGETVEKADASFRPGNRFDLGSFVPVPGAEGATVRLGAIGRGNHRKGEVAEGVSLANVTPPTRKRSAFDQNLYALAGEQKNEPAKRMSIQEFSAKLDKRSGDPRKAEHFLVRVTHVRLREWLLRALKKGGVTEVEKALVSWYKETAKGYDKCGDARHISHPTILARWKAIQGFLDKPDASIDDIPKDFSIRVIQEGRGRVTPLIRKGSTHYRQASSGIIAKVVGYCRNADGKADSGRPILLSVGPDWAVKIELGKRHRDLPELGALADPLAHDGTPIAARIRKRRRAILDWMQQKAQCAKIYWICAGHTIVREDGSRTFVHSFKKEDLPAAGELYQGIIEVRRGLIRSG